jgi:hypothetical protein
VSSVAGDNSDGLTWATAKASVAEGLALATADGDIVYVDSAHSFSSGAAISWDVATANTHIRIISVNRNGSATTGHAGPLAGATETVGVNAANFNIANAGRSQRLFIYGMICVGNSGAGTNNVIIAQTVPASATNTFVQVEFVSCVLKTPGTATSTTFFFGTNSNRPAATFILKDCEISVRNAVGAAKPITFGGAYFFISNLTISYTGASKPLSCFGATPNGGMHVIQISDSDLSGYDASGGAYFDLANGDSALFTLINCKLNSTPAIMTGSWRNSIDSITLINCDSGDTKTVFEYRNRQGTLTENTDNYASNGATMNGTNVSWQIVTTSDCNEQVPFVTPWIHKWGESIASQTQTLEFVHDSATNLDDREIWAEFERVSDANFPLGTLLSIRNSQPFDGTGTDHAAGSATWTLSPAMTNENKQKLSSGSITPAEKSLLRARVLVGVASKTLYLDPSFRIA